VSSEAVKQEGAGAEEMLAEAYHVDVLRIQIPLWAWATAAIVAVVVTLIVILIAWRTTRRKGPPPLPRG
jgi:hypothetical protein